MNSTQTLSVQIEPPKEAALRQVKIDFKLTKGGFEGFIHSQASKSYCKVTDLEVLQ